jgi:hypothetical protein
MCDVRKIHYNSELFLLRLYFQCISETILHIYNFYSIQLFFCSIYNYLRFSMTICIIAISGLAHAGYELHGMLNTKQEQQNRTTVKVYCTVS